MVIFYSKTVDADGFSPYEIDVLHAILNHDPVYKDAAFKTQEAFLIQTGFMSEYNRALSTVANFAQKKIDTAIQRNTPFKPKTLFITLSTAYAVGIKKQVSVALPDPLWNRITTVVSANQNDKSVSFSLSF